MGDFKISFEKLNEENYNEWAVQMKALLVTKGLWPGVTHPEDAANATATAKALALITLSVERHLLGQVAACANAKLAWEDLEKTYKSKNNARKLSLRQEMAVLKMKSNESVVVYVARARDLFRDLVAAGVEMKPEDLSWQVLVGLPPAFSTLRTILSASETMLSVEEMLPKLVIHEQMLVQEGTRLEEVEKEEVSTAVAYKAGKRGFSGKSQERKGSSEPRGDAHEVKKDLKCFKCLKTGHVAADCRGRITCHNCGTPGHVARECHKPKKEGEGEQRGVAFSATRGEANEKWVLDSGSTEHLTGDKSLFTTYEPLGGAGELITFGNKGELWAEGVGTVELRCELPSGEQVVTLKNVLYIPGVAANLFSIKKATKAGAEFHFTDKMCKVTLREEMVMQARVRGDLWLILEKIEAKNFFGRLEEKVKPIQEQIGQAKDEEFTMMVSEELLELVELKKEAFLESKEEEERFGEIGAEIGRDSTCKAKEEVKQEVVEAREPLSYKEVLLKEKTELKKAGIEKKTTDETPKLGIGGATKEGSVEGPKAAAEAVVEEHDQPKEPRRAAEGVEGEEETMNEEKVKKRKKSEEEDKVDNQIEDVKVVFEEKSSPTKREENVVAFRGSKVRFLKKEAEFKKEEAVKEEAWYRKLAQTLGLDVETVRIFVREKVTWRTNKDGYNDFINEGGTNDGGGAIEGG